MLPTLVAQQAHVVAAGGRGLIADVIAKHGIVALRRVRGAAELHVKVRAELHPDMECPETKPAQPCRAQALGHTQLRTNERLCDGLVAVG